VEQLGGFVAYEFGDTEKLLGFFRRIYSADMSLRTLSWVFRGQLSSGGTGMLRLSCVCKRGYVKLLIEMELLNIHVVLLSTCLYRKYSMTIPNSVSREVFFANRNVSLVPLTRGTQGFKSEVFHHRSSQVLWSSSLSTAASNKLKVNFC